MKIKILLLIFLSLGILNFVIASFIPEINIGDCKKHQAIFGDKKSCQKYKAPCVEVKSNYSCKAKIKYSAKKKIARCSSTKECGAILAKDHCKGLHGYEKFIDAGYTQVYCTKKIYPYFKD